MARWHVLGWTPDVSAEIAGELNRQRLVTIARHQPVAATAHIVNSLGLTALAVADNAYTGLLIALQALILVAAAFQVRSWWRHRGSKRTTAVPDAIITRAVVHALIFGCLWGAFVTTVLAGTPTREVELIACVVLAGMMAGGAAMLFTVPVAVIAFLGPVVVPPAAELIVQDRMSGLAGGGYALIYLGCLLAGARTWHANFVEGVALRLRNVDLANKAEAASRAKSRFLANMSHELRTPLNAIVGFAEMIDRQFHGPVGNARYLGFARAIREGGSHLGELIDDILDLSKIEAGAVDLGEDVTSPAALLDEAVTLVRPALDKSGLTIETILEPGLPDVKVDARRMRQSIVNVLSNAIKFTPAPGRIRVEIRRGQNGALLIKIGDTGVGIDRDDLADVTKPFVQGRNADARSLKGVGLGLSIAEQLLQLHGGTLWITSTAGVGTMVTMQLPADRAVERRAAAAG